MLCVCCRRVTSHLILVTNYSTQSILFALGPSSRQERKPSLKPTCIPDWVSPVSASRTMGCSMGSTVGNGRAEVLWVALTQPPQPGIHALERLGFHCHVYCVHLVSNMAEREQCFFSRLLEHGPFIDWTVASQPCSGARTTG